MNIVVKVSIVNQLPPVIKVENKTYKVGA